jgi:hypothetical protein
MGSKKFGVIEEASAQVGVALDVGEAAAHSAAQRLESVVGRVGQHRGIQIRPERFDGIEFGGIGGEPLDTQPATVLLQGVLGETAAVGREAIPEEDDSPPPMTPERVEETDEVGTADASRMKGQEPAEAPGGGRGEHEADSGQALPIEGLAQAGRPPLGGPSGSNRRPL